MSVTISRIRLAVLCAADGAALVALVPDPARIRTVLAHPHEAVLRTGADAALGDLADAAVWCAALWLGLGLAAMLAGAVPGAVGAAGRRLSRVLLPRLLRRAVAGAIGLGVLAAPVAAGAAVRTDGPVPPPRPPAPAAPAWPTDAAPARAPAPAPATPPIPSPTAAPTTTPTAAPTAAPAASVPAPVWPRTVPDAPPTTRPAPHPAGIPTTGSPGAGNPQAGNPKSGNPKTDNPQAGDPRTRTAPTGAPETVRPGDSLWVIAARRLGPGATDRAIAALWPRWYAANRAEIGADPDLVVAGQVLRPPTPTAIQPAPTQELP